jgi:hypothetical protein
MQRSIIVIEKHYINIISNHFFHNLSCLLSKKKLIKSYLKGIDLENALLQYIYKECLQNIVLIIARWFYNLTSLENK